jgi:hypothetical protein
MQRRRDTFPGHLSGRCLRPRSRALRGLVGLSAAALLSAGCSQPAATSPAHPSLLGGRRGGPLLPQRLAPAVRLARRFANAYARSVYLRRPPQLPGATAALERRLVLAASRVPAARRGLRPRALAVELEPRDASSLGASVEIGDGRPPSFSVSFTLRRRGRRWRVVAISPPG